MYKLLIVDDNPRDRQGLKEIIDWNQLGITVVGSCANGKQALEQVDSLKPDIIITDIAMPIMNGIEMARILEEKHKSIKIIFMSCYNEFDFAKSAIELGVYDYILKPIVPEELKQAVIKILGVYEKENTLQKEKEKMIQQINKSLPLFQEQFFREVLFGSITDPHEIQEQVKFLKIQLPDNYLLQVASMQLNAFDQYTSKMHIDEKYLTMYSIGEIINNFSNDNIYIYTLQISRTDYSILVFLNPESDSENKIVPLDIIISIKEAIYEELGVSTTIGVSNIGNDLSEASVLYQQSVRAVKTKFYDSDNQVILFEEINEISANFFEETVNLNELFNEVKQVISCGKEEDISRFLNKYLNENDLPTKNESFVKSFTFYVVNAIQIILMENKKSFEHIFGEQLLVWEKLNRFNTICDVKQWIKNVFRACIEYLIENNSGGYGLIVDKIKNVIRDKYQEHLTVNDIANIINFSANHANYIFKSETGQTIFDYLTEYRMERAKELLKDPYSRIYIVAEQVGYVNKSHFCLQFKKYTGMTPGEYKNRGVL